MDTSLHYEKLLQYFQNGIKDPNNTKIGLEIETCLYKNSDYSIVNYQDEGHQSVVDVLNDFVKIGWIGVYENNKIIGATSKSGEITIEPAGQIEFAPYACKNLIDLNNAIQNYFSCLKDITKERSIHPVHMGFNPKYLPNELPLVPKQRYKFMHNHMINAGGLGHYMMQGTCALQTALDYTSELDFGKKFKLATFIQPIIIAIFANSPFIKSQISPFLSYRSQIWLDTDKNRAGVPKFAFKEQIKFEDYLNYAIGIPMYFVLRNNTHINVSNVTFEEFITEKLQIPQLTPQEKDFELHLSTLFPDVRLKNYLEIRGADCPDKEYLMALPALFTGLFYNEQSLNSAYDMVKSWSIKDINNLRNNVSKEGLNSLMQNKKVQDIALELLDIAYKGLQNRNMSEEKFLVSMIDLVKSGKTMAEQKIELFNKLNGDMNKLLHNYKI